MTEVLITFLTTLGVALFQQHVHGAPKRAAQGLAKAVLESDEHPTTDIAVAVREAWVQAHQHEIDRAVDALQAQHTAGELRIREAVKRNAAVFEGASVELGTPDPSAPTKPGWPL